MRERHIKASAFVHGRAYAWVGKMMRQRKWRSWKELTAKQPRYFIAARASNTRLLMKYIREDRRKHRMAINAMLGVYAP